MVSTLSQHAMTPATSMLRVLVAFAPLVFIAHVLEEAPGFVAWFNSHVSRGITSQSFWQVNVTALVITVAVSLLAWLDTSTGTALATVAWLSCLMGANALIHITGALVDGRYVPGLVTAIFLYLPYCGLVFRHVKRGGVSSSALLVTASIGAIPMLIHGYRILFLGTRLF